MQLQNLIEIWRRCSGRVSEYGLLLFECVDAGDIVVSADVIVIAGTSTGGLGIRVTAKAIIDAANVAFHLRN